MALVMQLTIRNTLTVFPTGGRIFCATYCIESQEERDEARCLISFFQYEFNLLIIHFQMFHLFAT